MDDHDTSVETEALDDLEQVMRAGLQRRADRADVQAPVLARAQGAARGERRGRTAVVVGLAAASVVAVAVVGAVSVVGRDEPAPDRSAAPVSPTAPAPTSPSSTGSPALDGTASGPLRTEYYAGLRVDVPAGWGWASSPVLCGEAPAGESYVGRPISVTDACGLPDPDAVPTAPYVWMGADVPVGTLDLGDGWVRETVLVEGTALSVAAQDAGLRAEILGSVDAQDLCAPTLAQVPEPLLETTVEGAGDFVEAHLCAYRDVGTGLSLVYAKELDETTESATFAAAGDAPASSTRCGAPFEVVTVDAVHDDPYSERQSLRLDSRVVYDLSCGTVGMQLPQRTGIRTHRLTEATVQPWATEEFRHLLTGPPAPWVYRYFIGIQG